MSDADVYEKIIWSADLPSQGTLWAKLKEIDKPIIVKIDRLFHTNNGYDIHDLLRQRGVKVFNDAKLIEIPSKLEELAKAEIRRSQPWMLNCMAGSLSTMKAGALKRDEVDGLKRFADVCMSADVLPCAVTVLTSKTEVTAQAEFSNSRIEQVLYYAMWLVTFGFTDLVCSPLEAAAIRKESVFDSINLNTPGVRMPGDDAGDQANVATPGDALRNGVNRVVIGRPITNSDDPAATVEAIAADMSINA